MSKSDSGVEAPEKKKWTIHDIAREAGVSAKTVSQVLNNKPGVREETRAQILKIIKDVGYYPHIGARSLRGKGRGSIGVTVTVPPEVAPISEELFLQLFAKLTQVFGGKGEYLSFDLSPFSSHASKDYARGLWEQIYKACLLVGPLANDDDTVMRIHKSGAPYLALGRHDRVPDCSCATINYEEGAYLSTKYLIERGHKRIGILKALSGYQPGTERRRGYLRALEEAGIAPDENLIRSVGFKSDNIANMVYRVLSDRGVTALVDSSGSEDARGIREGARKSGRVPGEDFEIVAWTYSDNAAVLAEACAHVWLPVREAAYEGIEWFSDWIYGKRKGPVKIVYHPVLQERVAGGEIPKPRRLFETV